MCMHVHVQVSRNMELHAGKRRFGDGLRGGLLDTDSGRVRAIHGVQFNLWFITARREVSSGDQRSHGFAGLLLDIPDDGVAGLRSM